MTFDINAKLKHQISKVDGYNEINNLIGRTVIAYMFHNMTVVLEAFSECDEVSLYFPRLGEVHGKGALNEALNELISQPLKVGQMEDIHLCNPIIRIGDDANEATGKWKVIDAAADVYAEDSTEPKAVWEFGVLEADFVNENFEWKIKKLRYSRKVRCDYDVGWGKEMPL